MEQKLIVDGKRIDGRTFDQLRPMEARAGILKNADGSGYFRLGRTIAIAGIFGPRQVHPRHMEEAEAAILKCRYNMASFSTTERNRPGPSRRSKEISKVIREALMPVLFLEEFPKSAIDLHVEILQADASTRCAGINAASIALADAGIPMRDLIASCSVGVVEGQIMLDIAGKEDTEGDVDLPIAYYPKRDLITLLQMDGMVTREQLKQLLELAKKGAMQVYEAQRQALRSKYLEE
ncbi:MAG: exosome complex exonuclease Rrp41 [Candidatus Aenigmarchaeota archaeon ex4484_14]|nr:MAG: exosome complex exonuclease Rrp41 [Candidatus Aenigmarchaeota archaeon ex4484_14]